MANVLANSMNVGNVQQMRSRPPLSSRNLPTEMAAPPTQDESDNESIGSNFSGATLDITLDEPSNEKPVGIQTNADDEVSLDRNIDKLTKITSVDASSRDIYRSSSKSLARRVTKDSVDENGAVLKPIEKKFRSQRSFSSSEELSTGQIITGVNDWDQASGKRDVDENEIRNFYTGNYSGLPPASSTGRSRVGLKQARPVSLRPAPTKDVRLQDHLSCSSRSVSGVSVASDSLTHNDTNLSIVSGQESSRSNTTETCVDEWENAVKGLVLVRLSERNMPGQQKISQPVSSAGGKVKPLSSKEKKWREVFAVLIRDKLYLFRSEIVAKSYALQLRSQAKSKPDRSKSKRRLSAFFSSSPVDSNSKLAVKPLDILSVNSCEFRRVHVQENDSSMKNQNHSASVSSWFGKRGTSESSEVPSAYNVSQQFKINIVHLDSNAPPVFDGVKPPSHGPTRRQKSGSFHSEDSLSFSTSFSNLTLGSGIQPNRSLPIKKSSFSMVLRTLEEQELWLKAFKMINGSQVIDSGKLFIRCMKSAVANKNRKAVAKWIGRDAIVSDRYLKLYDECSNTVCESLQIQNVQFAPQGSTSIKVSSVRNQTQLALLCASSKADRDHWIEKLSKSQKDS